MKQYGDWKVTLPDEAYDWHPDDTTLSEQLMIENESGTTFGEWIQQIDDERAEACQILVWFLRRKQGVQVDRFAVDFPIRRLAIRPAADPEDDGSGEASAGSEPATSAPSAGSESDPGSSTA